MPSFRSQLKSLMPQDLLGGSLTLNLIFRNTSQLQKPPVFIIRDTSRGPQRFYSNFAGGFGETSKFSASGEPLGGHLPPLATPPWCLIMSCRITFFTFVLDPNEYFSEKKLNTNLFTGRYEIFRPSGRVSLNDDTRGSFAMILFFKYNLDPKKGIYEKN